MARSAATRGAIPCVLARCAYQPWAGSGSPAPCLPPSESLPTDRQRSSNSAGRARPSGFLGPERLTGAPELGLDASHRPHLASTVLGQVNQPTEPTFLATGLPLGGRPPVVVLAMPQRRVRCAVAASTATSPDDQIG